MPGWLEALIVGVTAIIFIILTFFYLIIRRRFISAKVAVTQPELTEPKTAPFQPVHEPKRRSSYQLFNRGSSTKTMFFDWADHPTLITNAVENGWSRFAFTCYNPSSSSVRSTSSLFRSLRVTSDRTVSNQHHHVEESWEIGLESVDFMQKLHFKSNGSELSTKSTVRMALPLPGPQVTNSFPQEAYFEITVVGSEEGRMMKGSDGENAKLLSQQSDSAALKNSEGIVHVSRKVGGCGDGVKMMVLGLSVGVGGWMMNKVPGTYAGSIGFYSDGSVHLSGMKLIFESAKEDWAQTGKVIGCGFDPKLKKVFFTVNSELVHVIHCKSDDFGRPLYPVLSSNIDITVQVNLGQSKFSYAPANAHRTPNPCFIAPMSRSSPAAAGYEDSKELFSMERLDLEPLSRKSATVRSNASACNIIQQTGYYSNNDRTVEFDEDSDAELFEIVLDSVGKETMP